MNQKFLQIQGSQFGVEQALFESFDFSDSNIDKIVNLFQYFQNVKPISKDELDSAVKKYKEKENKQKEELKKHNINTDKLYSIIKESVNESGIKNVKDITVSKVKKISSKTFLRLREEHFFEGIGPALILLIVNIVINTVMINILIASLGPLGMVIGACVVAPINEEFAKYLSVKYDLSGAYFIVFNITEFSLYVVQMTISGIPLIAAIIPRLIAVGFHYSLTQIHLNARDREGLFDKYIKKTDSETENKSYIALGCAILMHAVWNFFATIRMLK